MVNVSSGSVAWVRYREGGFPAGVSATRPFFASDYFNVVHASVSQFRRARGCRLSNSEFCEGRPGYVEVNLPSPPAPEGSLPLSFIGYRGVEKRRATSDFSLKRAEEFRRESMST